MKTSPMGREGMNLFRNWGSALAKTLKHVCTTAKRVGKQIARAAKKIDWKRVGVTVGAIGVGIALTVATGGLGAPAAMALGRAATGAIISGYDGYTSGKRGWELVGAIGQGAGVGALTGFVGGHLMGAGAGIATSATQNIRNQAVRHVVKAGIEAGVETAVDTGISVATGSPVTLKNVVTDYGLNLVTNGSGSISNTSATKPIKVGGVEVYDANYKHTRPIKDVTPVNNQKLLTGPAPNALRLEAPKTSGKPDFYVATNGNVIPATGYRYMSSDAPYLSTLKNTMEIPANPSGTYISFNDYAMPNPEALQVPHDASIKATFDTKQILDDIRIPNGKWGKADYLEPLTSDFPQFGSGGATQAITTESIKIDKLVDLRRMP